MKLFLKLILWAILPVYVFFAAVSSAAAAPRNAVLYFLELPGLKVGDPVEFTVFLTTEKGKPLLAQDIDFYLDGQYAATLVTDRSGSVRYIPDREFTAGSYVVEAVYAGYQFDVAGPVSLPFEIAPAEIVVQTVPTIANLELMLNGSSIKTGLDGIVRIPIQEKGVYDLELLPNTEILNEKDAVFVQWFPNEYETKTQVVVPGETWIQVGFEITSQFSFAFVDPEGNSIATERIESVQLRGSNGAAVTISPQESSNLDVNRILSRLSGLDSTTVAYTIEQVNLDGSTVVNQGQQRFIYSPGRDVRVELLVYDVRFYGEDVFLGTGNGRGLFLEMPDGETVYFAFEDGHELTISNLARGAYFAEVDAEGGVGIRFPLVLSRSQEVRLPVISYFDIVLIVFAAGTVIFGLPVWGRRRQILQVIFGVNDEDQEAGNS